MFLNRLRKLVGGAGRAEAEAAAVDAERRLSLEQTRTAEIRELTDKLRAHGERNHFGERINLAWRRAG